jgi:uncharacterized protein (TIGR00297 family)
MRPIPTVSATLPSAALAFPGMSPAARRLGDPVQLGAGLLLAAAIALAAHRAGSLDRSGAWAAVGVGGAAVSAGWGWGGLLVGFFVSSSLLSRWRRHERERRTGAIVAKGGARDAAQVLANGGTFAVTVLVLGLYPTPWLAGAAAGSIAAAAADTWATEIGTLLGGTPRTLLGGHEVPPGTSGAVSGPGSAAMIAGAAAMGLLALALGLGRAAATGALLGGVAGAVADTVAGGWLQERRWCDRCSARTERAVHDCGAATRRVGGVAGIGNDVVNVVCSAVGATAGAIAGGVVGR